MKELVIISGKGGTGKTSLISAFASLAENMVLCDADVDAADLHLIMDPDVKQRSDFQGGHTAVIKKEKCTECNICRDLCRWDAVDEDFEGLGFASALFTYGNKDHNLTTGLGWGYVETDFSSEPVITLSGMTRLSSRIGLVTENWFVPEPDEDGYEPVFSYGIRFMGEKIAVDLMFINHPEIAKEIVIGIPIVNFTFNF